VFSFGHEGEFILMIMIQAGCHTEVREAPWIDYADLSEIGIELELEIGQIYALYNYPLGHSFRVYSIE
jgi:hypothetical protein